MPNSKLSTLTLPNNVTYDLKDSRVPDDAVFTDTTYDVVSKNANGLAPQLPNETTTTKFLRQDGTWQVPATGSGTVTSITIKATSPIAIDSASAITTSGTRTLSHANSGATAGSYGDSAAQTPAYGATFKVPYVTVNATGHVTGISEHTVKIPASDNTDTKNTAGSTNSTSKLFLVGATSQAANPQTYSNSNVYATNGVMNATSYDVAATAHISYDSTEQAILFTFN